MSELTRQTPIQYLKGVGERRAELLQKLRIFTVGDLLLYFPRDYIDLSAPFSIEEAPLQVPCAIRARIVGKSREQRIRSGLSIFKMTVADDSGEMDITVFNSRYTVEAMKLDEEYIFYGKVAGTLLKREMTSPAIHDLPKENAVLPVYAQTAGINSKFLRKCIAQAMPVIDSMPEPLPPGVLLQYRLPDRAESLRSIHFPENLAAAERARARLIFEELLVLSCALSTLHAENTTRTITPMQPQDIETFYASLPFAPTGAQRRCVDDAVGDMCSSVPMNRLIQGDVGSGKTLVAAACVWFAKQSGAQAAVMVPTEILAEQHYTTFSGFLEPFGLRLALLTGSTKTAERRRVLAGLADGSIDLVIGTHALLSEGVEFRDMRLIVTDEQHRFGVAQRAKLSQKSEDAHVLVMSATPIPRTLSLIIYGDLKLSVIDELPPGRQPVETLVISGAKRERAMGFVRDALDKGQQAYIVCPLVEQGEVQTDLKPAVEYQQILADGILKGYRLGLLHGKMKPKDKDDTMRRFKLGEIQALVSTTVVEVGVDVPNATIILIENAERFGLSQLHQLRGRVGRGTEKSWCILVSDSRAEATRERLRVMRETSDGFKVAEYDLNLRGPGDFFGYRQHGLPTLRVADLAGDMQAMEAAQQCVAQILADDPALERPAHRLLGEATREMLHTVGERPN